LGTLLRAYFVPPETKRGFSFCVIAFSRRKPVSTLLENALAVGR
jgi:hypothetical protein